MKYNDDTVTFLEGKVKDGGPYSRIYVKVDDKFTQVFDNVPEDFIGDRETNYYVVNDLGYLASVGVVGKVRDIYFGVTKES